MSYTQMARRLRPLIEAAAQSLPEADALDGVELYPAWIGDGRLYSLGFRVQYGGILYSVLIEHTSQPAG